jgi:hypothetical protein
MYDPSLARALSLSIVNSTKPSNRRRDRGADGAIPLKGSAERLTRPGVATFAQLETWHAMLARNRLRRLFGGIWEFGAYRFGRRGDY